MSATDIREMQQQALAIASRYRAVGASNGEHDWTARDYANGFVKDLGDLMKLLMIHDNLRSDGADDELKTKLGHELSDCLWSVLVIAKKLDIDIVDAFDATMQELDGRLQREEAKHED